jgi:thiol-disulfide isomerase/thioredoxin
MTRTQLILCAAVVAAALVAVAIMRTGGISTGEPVALTSGRGVTVKFSDRPVDMPRISFTDLEGRSHSSESLRGKVVLVNFWATWCAPCREEIPMLIALQEHYRDQLVVVGLSVDERPAADVRTFAQKFNVNYPIVMASEELQTAFGGISVVPSTFIVNPDGRIAQRHLGILQAQRTEHEVRLLAGLSTDATVQTVKDTGQVLLDNAAYATEIPGLELGDLTAPEKESILLQLNTEHCTCGCKLTLAQCRINDPTCEVSLPLAKKLLAAVKAGQPAGRAIPKAS